MITPHVIPVRSLRFVVWRYVNVVDRLLAYFIHTSLIVIVVLNYTVENTPVKLISDKGQKGRYNNINKPVRIHVRCAVAPEYQCPPVPGPHTPPSPPRLSGYCHTPHPTPSVPGGTALLPRPVLLSPVHL